jgi:hypothetical protein
MHTFAHKPKATQQITPSKATKYSQPSFRQSREVNSILHLQRTIGDQRAQRLLQNNCEGIEANSGGARMNRIDHDFSRIPVGPARTDFQQLGAGPSLQGEEREDTLDQQLSGSSALPGPSSAAGNLSTGGGNSPPVPQQILQPPVAAGPTVTFSTPIRASTTPASMAPDRIPPRVDFPVGVTIANFQIPMRLVEITVDGSGGSNGSVTVDGSASIQTAASGTIQLRGTTQTTPGNAGNLRLLARWGGQLLASSNLFSVAAIPQDMALSNHTALTGNSRGFVVTQTWSSDSGNLADLNQAQVSEAVQYVNSTGIFSGLGAANSGYLAAQGGSLTDTHSTPVAALTGPGTRSAHQTEMFRDNRTGVTDIPMRNSGFIIGRVVTSSPQPSAPPLLQITTSKRGSAVTANGITSSAGSGNISLTQNV